MVTIFYSCSFKMYSHKVVKSKVHFISKHNVLYFNLVGNTIKG